MDSNKLRLLKSYSGFMTASLTYSSDFSQPPTSPSGLEKLFPRTSTPYPDDSLVTEDEDCFAPYEIFRRILEKPPKKSPVRGLKKIPYHFLTGHLIKPKKGEKIYFSTLSLDSTESTITTTATKKWDMKQKLISFRKVVANFFKKYYNALTRNNCDYKICPVTCDCRVIKSFLNKTIRLDDEIGEAELKVQA